MMSVFQMKEGKTETCTAGGRRLQFTAWRGLDYCDNPKDPIQKLNVFMPAAYADGGQIGPYARENAPIFLPNTVGGYMPGPADEPGEDRFGQPNSIFLALEHGYVVASGGVRGRTSGRQSSEFFEGAKAGGRGSKTDENSDKRISEDGALSAGERMTGRAPAFIVDYKAIIRYLKANRDSLPGNTDRIITNGTSAGGALSALAGASGNSPDFEPYLKEIGAADETDDVFAASCYCPICNLEHADAAYEWLYRNETVYHQMKFEMTENGVKPHLVEGVLSAAMQALSEELKASFPTYVNSLGLTGESGSLYEGQLLTLDESGEGSFREYICTLLTASFGKELETGYYAENAGYLMVKGCMEDVETYLKRVPDGGLKLDLGAFAAKITRMKPVPAFDALDLSSPENEEFGTETTDRKHFTEFSQAHSSVPAQSADLQIVKMMNPMSYIQNAQTAKHWRIRHGSFDRDTSFAIPAILALTLENAGYDVDFELPWGLPHSGDYDPDRLFAWIDRCCGVK